MLGFFGGNFALFSLWLPEQFETRVRATAFAFCTSIGRFVGAGVNFLLGAAVLHSHTLGFPVALTAIVFLAGLFIIPLAPGGAIDVMVRALGKAFEQRNPYGFIVESRAGANTIIAANACKAATPDGSTVAPALRFGLNSGR